MYAVQLPLEQDPEVSWKPHRLFRGSTPSIARIGCHVSVLDTGCRPHPPHRHAEEEILLILDGETDLVLEDARDPEAVLRERVHRGTFAYYPTDFAHTIHNTSGRPVTYGIFKWTTNHRARTSDLGHRLVSASQPHAGTEGSGRPGFATNRVIDGGTRCLQRLQSHLTTLQPGAGYAPHIDRHDVAIVTLEGVVETIGERAEPNSVIFYPAGEPHGMRNVGDTPAVYLVFEFHRRHWSNAPRVENQVRRIRRLKSRAAQRFTSPARSGG